MSQILFVITHIEQLLISKPTEVKANLINITILVALTSNTNKNNSILNSLFSKIFSIDNFHKFFNIKIQ